MIRINLLPVRASRKRETALRQLAMAGLGLLLVVGGIAYIHVSLASDVEAARTRNKQLEDDIEHLKKVIGQVEEFEQKKQELQKKLDIIKTLKSNKTGPVHMLDEIAINLPEKCWLGSISEANRKVTLTGSALNNEVIADFISKLDQSNYFDDVYLVSTKLSKPKKNQTIKLMDFSLTARMVTPEEKKGKEIKPGKEIESNDDP